MPPLDCELVVEDIWLKNANSYNVATFHFSFCEAYLTVLPGQQYLALFNICNVKRSTEKQVAMRNIENYSVIPYCN